MTSKHKKTKQLDQSVSITISLHGSQQSLAQLLGQFFDVVLGRTTPRDPEVTSLIADAAPALLAAPLPHAHPLTRSELKIAELVASQYSNKQIAATLVVSENTVKTHLQNIYKKLGISNRGQLLEWMSRMSAARDAEPRQQPHP